MWKGFKPLPKTSSSGFPISPGPLLITWTSSSETLYGTKVLRMLTNCSDRIKSCHRTVRIAKGHDRIQSLLMTQCPQALTLGKYEQMVLQLVRGRDSTPPLMILVSSTTCLRCYWAGGRGGQCSYAHDTRYLINNVDSSSLFIKSGLGYPQLQPLGSSAMLSW